MSVEKKEKMKRLAEVDVKIVKMKESSGNEQFFVRLSRNDVPSGVFCLEGLLEHQCFQTKNLEKEKCLERAWFTAGFLARFVGLSSMDEVIIVGLDESETEILKSSLTIFR